MPRRSRRWWGVSVLALAGLGTWWAIARDDRRDAAPNYRPVDAQLQLPGLSFWVPPDGSAPRAVVIFLGNDVGFWRPHRVLADVLARNGDAVMGVDIRDLLDSLPADSAAREARLASRVAMLERRAYDELRSPRGEHSCGAEESAERPRPPLVVAGHSLGAELALWVAVHASHPALRGVLAISPGSRSHLRISAQDLLMTGEPTERGSFAVAHEVKSVAANAGTAGSVRIAIVRGMGDKLRTADPALLAAGGSVTRRFLVPLVGHSMKRLITAEPIIRHALGWLVAPPDAGAPALARATPYGDE